MTADYITFGCKVNVYETEQIRELLFSVGFTPAEDGNADVYIVNSCAVTAQSAAKVRRRLSSLRREHPESVIVLTGCLGQAFPDAAGLLKDADIVTGNKNNAALPDLVDEFLKTRERIVRIEPHEKGEDIGLAGITRSEGHTRAFVKIQDGCDRFCSYCIIPYARGRQRSRPIAELRNELGAIRASGYKEVVLTGINLTAYDGGDGADFVTAVSAASSAGFERVRLGSLEPDDISAEQIGRLAAIDGFCPHFHISLQSGSDAVLKKMNRRYTASDFSDLAGRLRSAFPDCALTTDVICGFPGETDADFAETLAFVKKIAFEKVHVFPFSAREGTPAAKFAQQIPKAVKTERCRLLSECANELRRDHFMSLAGKTLPVLLESRRNGVYKGYTENYTPVEAPHPDGGLTGEIVQVDIIGSRGCDVCTGKLRL
ncbi:MAG: tRNA (N(6)-L-threonylcarbamoyladenosine(37)-C(2))-methylthiotransferase MtaB [Clostridia bacterium]|nr:tRNA (N(6)-L-threonylcarbamoyladenosine(37)-C(2))-methylthiotransferase MtaB [Clostridia bacterium]